MSPAPEQSACQDAVFRLTDVERERLWRLFEPAARDLARFAAAMLRFRSIADGKDVVQEAFVSFARRAVRGGLRCLGNRRIAEIDDSELEQRIPSCRAYLICVVLHKCCSLYRKERLRPLAVDELVTNNVQARDADPADTSSRQELADGLQRAILSLPEHLRKVLMLHYHGRLSGEETAEALGIPIGTVKSRLHASRKRLRSLLLPEMIEDLS